MIRLSTLFVAVTTGTVDTSSTSMRGKPKWGGAMNLGEPVEDVVKTLTCFKMKNPIPLTGLGVFIWKQVRVSTTSSTGSPRFIAPHSGFPLIEVELVSTVPVVTATNPLSCSLGPTVTCRDGTCVHHPGYCHESRLKQSLTRQTVSPCNASVQRHTYE